MAVKTVQAIINGTTTTLTLNEETGLYEASLAAPSTSSYNVNTGHYYPVTIKATDDAGNTTTVSDTDATLGDSCKLEVTESTAPVITITSPTEGQCLTNSAPTIQWTVTDDDSGVDSDTISLTVDDDTAITSGITKATITNGYSCSYTLQTALDDGTHTVYIDASDNYGNAATQRTVNFTVDTIPPTLSVTSPTNNLATNETEIAVAGTTNDVTSNPVTVTVKVNDGDAEEVTVGSTGTFSMTVTLESGTNTITVTATDAAGKTSSVTRTVTLDATAPTISAVTISPNPVSTGEVLTISVSVTDS